MLAAAQHRQQKHSWVRHMYDQQSAISGALQWVKQRCFHEQPCM
jgi:hypothetical protein